MKKLQKYITLSAATLSSGVINAGIIYTDVNPDVTLDTDGDSYDIDFDGDAVADFTLRFNNQSGYWGNWRVNELNGNLGNSVAGVSNYSYYGGSNFAQAYFYNDVVDAGLNWVGSYAQLGWYWNDGGGSTYTSGYWPGAQDMYAAAKFGISGNTHYGWIRMDVGPVFDYISIKDFAYEDVPNAPIEAGATLNPNLIAANIVATDIANNGNGLDLEVTFDPAPQETGILEYRVITVKSSNADDFKTADANGIASYVSVIPDGTSHSISFRDNSKDASGELIVNDVPYFVFVLSVPDLDTLYTSNLSLPSNEVTLTTSVAIEKQVLNNASVIVAGKVLNITSAQTLDQVSIFDASGKNVFQQSNISNETINLNHVNTGIYHVALEHNGHIKTKKIILP